MTPDYERRGIKLFCADCLDVLPTLEPGSVDAVVTDPPYSERTHSGHNSSANGHLGIGLDGSQRRELLYPAWDAAMVHKSIAVFTRVCAGWIVVFTDHTLAPEWHSALETAGRYVFAPLPFYAPGSRVRLSGDGPSSWTTWIIVARTAAQSRWGTLPGGYVDGHNEKRAIAGAKPLGVMRALVTDYSRENDVVCDPCLGSGTTGIACIRTGRKFIGVEIDRRYFDIAVKRIDAELDQGRLEGM